MIDFVFRILFDFEFFLDYLPNILGFIGLVIFVGFIIWMVND